MGAAGALLLALLLAAAVSQPALAGGNRRITRAENNRLQAQLERLNATRRDRRAAARAPGAPGATVQRITAAALRQALHDTLRSTP